MLTIDGSLGEGGGQILRTSLALSLVTGAPFRIEKIRAGREKPGLLKQHLTSVNAAAEIGEAEVSGNSIGSTELTFVPKRIKHGDYTFSVGTAGSTTLVLQTVLPALLTAEGSSTLALVGGTHNPSAPSFDFLEKTFLPIINCMGPKISATLERAGFFPAGGGRLIVEIEPITKLAKIDLLERGDIIDIRARAIIASLPLHVAYRELDVIQRRMSLAKEKLQTDIRESAGPGNAVIIEAESKNITQVFTSFGRLGVRAEKVAQECVEQAKKYIDANVPVGEYLADQLLLPVALAGGGSFKTLALSSHSLTNIEVIKKFIKMETTTNQDSDQVTLVTLKS